jgi:hypothetical protein
VFRISSFLHFSRDTAPPATYRTRHSLSQPPHQLVLSSFSYQHTYQQHPRIAENPAQRTYIWTRCCCCQLVPKTDFCWKMTNPLACQMRLLNKIKSGTGKSIDLTPSNEPWLFELLVNNHRERIVQPPKKSAPRGVWWEKMRLGNQYRRYEVTSILNGMKILHLGRSLAQEKSAARGIARDAGLEQKTSYQPVEINKLREVVRFPQRLDDGFYQWIFTYSWKYKERGSSSSVHDLLD